MKRKCIVPISLITIGLVLFSGLANAEYIAQYGPAIEHPVPTAESYPYGLGYSPADKCVYFSEVNAAKIGKISPNGDIAEYELNEGYAPVHFAYNANNKKMYFTEYTGHIGTIDTKGNIQYFDSEFEQPMYITYNEKEKSIYFCSDSGQMGIIDAVGNLIWDTLPHSTTRGITYDSNNEYVYYTSLAWNLIGRIDSNLNIHTYEMPGYWPDGIAFNSHDNCLYFTENHNHGIGKMTETGQVTFYPSTDELMQSPVRITFNPNDNNVYFTCPGTSTVGRMNEDGEFFIMAMDYIDLIDVLFNPYDSSIYFSDTVYNAIFELPCLNPPKPETTTAQPQSIWDQIINFIQDNPVLFTLAIFMVVAVLLALTVGGGKTAGKGKRVGRVKR